MTKREQTEQLQQATLQTPDAWERLGWLWSAIFYCSLLSPTLAVLSAENLTPAQRIWVIGLSILSGIWHWLGAIKWMNWRADCREKHGINAFYLIVAIGLWYSLVRLHPWFYFLLFGLYGQIYAFLPLRFSIPGSIGLSIWVVYLQLGQTIAWYEPGLWLTVGLISGTGVLFSIWISGIIGQSIERRQLIEDLARTQADLVAAERQAGMLAERQRLAREIHDTLAQGFTSIVMHLEAAEQSLLDGQPTARHHLDLARRTARESLTQARRVVQDLRPEMLEQGSLAEAIRRVVGRWGEESAIVARATITGEICPLPPEIEVTLLRATQESLANVRKHAHAGQVNVTLSYMADLVVLDVQDDGVGFRDETRPASIDGGFGLTAMRERVEQLGGSLLIESAPAEGTTLVVTIPLQESGITLARDKVPIEG